MPGACLSVVSVVCCQATDRSPVQSSPTVWVVLLCVIEMPQELGGPGSRWAVPPEGNGKGKNTLVKRFGLK